MRRQLRNRCLALPAGALAHYALEVLTATGRELLATAIFRVGVPATTLACFGHPAHVVLGS